MFNYFGEVSHLIGDLVHHRDVLLENTYIQFVNVAELVLPIGVFLHLLKHVDESLHAISKLFGCVLRF